MLPRDPFDDDINDLIGGTLRPMQPEKPRTATAPYTGPQASQHTEACERCHGTGRWTGRVRSFPCNACNGTGKRSFKTSAAQRAKGRETSARKATDKRIEQQAWRDAHRDVIEWLSATAERQHERAHKGQSVWGFPISLNEAIAQYGSLTDPQLAAVRACMARDQERKAQWTAEATQRDQARPACDASLLTAAFDKAKAFALARAPNATGVTALRLTIQSYTFSPDKTNNGEVWARGANGWLGKTEGGKFKRFRACSDADEKAILAICNDPGAAARAHGLATNNCACCGLPLTNPESVALGIGPVCRDKYGF